MRSRIKLGKEMLFFVFVVMISLVFWLILAIIIEQNITAQEYLYMREKNAFIVTVGFIYFIRFNAWMSD